jgi:hypothetical protein
MPCFKRTLETVTTAISNPVAEVFGCFQAFEIGCIEKLLSRNLRRRT